MSFLFYNAVQRFFRYLRVTIIRHAHKNRLTIHACIDTIGTETRISTAYSTNPTVSENPTDTKFRISSTNVAARETMLKFRISLTVPHCSLGIAQYKSIAGGRKNSSAIVTARPAVTPSGSDMQESPAQMPYSTAQTIYHFFLFIARSLKNVNISLIVLHSFPSDKEKILDRGT